MLDTKRLLDQFLGQSVPRGQQPMRGGDMLGNIARGLGGGGGVPGGSGGMGNVAMMGGLAALLMGSRSGRKLAGSALNMGGMAAVGMLAYQAYKKWQASQGGAGFAAPQPGAAPPAGTPFNPTSEPEQQRLARNLLRAMIAAAKADGHIDAKEQAAVFSEMDKCALDDGDKAFLMDELRKPLDADSVASSARSPEEAAELYAASLLAIDADNATEAEYLRRLAERLKLDPQLVAQLHATIEGATERARV